MVSVVSELQRNIGADDTVLDLGCGGMGMTITMKCGAMLGVDVWYPYVHSVKDVHLTLCMRLDGRTMRYFVDKSFDVVLAVDFIEHIGSKEEAFDLIRDMERIARKRVVIYTPRGYVKQKDGKTWGEGNPKYQSHKCGFTESELAMMGYTVDVHRGIDEDKKIDAVFAVKILGEIGDV